MLTDFRISFGGRIDSKCVLKIQPLLKSVA